MTQLLTSFPPTTSSSSEPTYQCDLTRTIGVLQQLQVLCAAQGQGYETSLADVIRVVRDMQLEFGEDSRLERVIQALVGQHIDRQLAPRRIARQAETMEVLA